MAFGVPRSAFGVTAIITSVMLYLGNTAPVRAEETSNVERRTSNAAGWHFTVGQSLIYTYECTQQVSWASAGDQLSYITLLRFRFVLSPTLVTDERAELTATFLSVRAEHRGPGSLRVVDSSHPPEERGSEDLMLGHLLALENAVFSLSCDPRTGAVSAVQGGDEVARRIAASTRSDFKGAANPDEPSPLLKPAEKAYASENLSRLWSQLLATAGDGPRRVDLGPPLAITVEQTWKAHQWTCALPTGALPSKVTLATEPAPVEAALSALSGKGAVTPAAVPRDNQGELRYCLRFTALTQPVEQKHVLTWRLRREGGSDPR